MYQHCGDDECFCTQCSPADQGDGELSVVISVLSSQVSLYVDVRWMSRAQDPLPE